MQLAGNDPLNDSMRKADLRRIFLTEAASKVTQAEERVRKCEVRLAELEERAKELKDLAELAQGSKAARRGGTAASGAAEPGNELWDSDEEDDALLAVTRSTESENAVQEAEKAQDRAAKERYAVELAKRELEQAQSEKQRLSGGGPLLMW